MKLKKIVSVITILALFSENSICVNAYVAQNTQHSKTEYSDYIEKDIVSADNNLSEATSERKSNNSNNILGPQHNGAIPSPINYPYEPEEDALEGESNQLRAYASNDASDVNYYADYYVDGQYTANYFSSHTTSIKNQCFSDNYYLDSNNCWILSTLAAYESAVHKNLNVSNLDLSEEHARVNIYGGTDGIDTDHRFISKISNVSSYSVVGDFEKILAYLLRGYTKNNIIKYGPVCETSSLPFADNNNTNLNEINCTGLNYYPTAVNYIGNVINYPTTPDYSLTKGRVNAIKKLIVDNGNVIAAYYTDENFDCDGIDVGNNSAKKNFSNKNNTQYHYNNYYGDSCNYGRHMVEIVGWDDSIPYNKFNNYPQHNGAFIVKNSYGEHYSYEYPYTSADGFIYLSYDEADRIFDIRSFQTIENLRNVTNIYENDYLGNIDQAHLNKYQDGLSSQNRIFTLSKFDTQSQSELLSKVNINIADKATGFKIFVSCTGNLNNLTEIPIVTNGNFERSGDYYYCKNYAGNYVVDLARTCHITSDSFYVGVEYYKNGGNIILPIERSRSDTYGTEVIESKPAHNQGHSYILKKSNAGNYLLDKKSLNNYVDVNSISETEFRGDFCIKAYTEAYNIATLTNGFHNISDIAEGSVATKAKLILSNNNFGYVYGTNDNHFNINYSNPAHYGNKTFYRTIELHENNRMDFKVNSNVRITLSLRGSGNGGSFKLYNARTGELLATKAVKNTITDIFYDYRGTSDVLSLEYYSGTGIEVFGIEIGEIPQGVGSYINDIWNISDATIINDDIHGVNGNIIHLQNSETRRITIENCNQSLNGISYTKCLKLSGESELYGGCIELGDVPQNSYIDIVARVEDNAEEPVGLFIDNWITAEGINAIKQFPIRNNINTYRYYYTGNTQVLRLSLRRSSVKIYSIAIQTRINNNDKVDRIIDFDSPEFLGITTINNNVAVGGVDFYASSLKDMKFKNSELTFDNIKHRRCLCLNGEGIYSLRQIGIPIDGTCDIRIIAKSNDNSNRNLIVTDNHNNLLDTITVSPSCGKYTVSNSLYSSECGNNEAPHSYIGLENEIYIKAEDSAINIYAIIIDNNTSYSYNVYSENYVESFNADATVSGSAIILESSDVKENDAGTTLTNSVDENAEIITESLDDSYDVDLTHRNFSFMPLLENNRTSTTFEYYDSLSTVEKNLYDKMVETYCDSGYGNNYIHFNADFGITTPYSASNLNNIRKSIRTAVTAFINDHPEVFWLENKYYCVIKRYTYDNTEYIGQVSFVIPRYAGGFNTDDSVLIQITQLNNCVDDIIDDMENGSYKFNADYLKLKEIFDFMVDEYTYTSTKTTSTLNLHNSYGAIVGEYGSCTGLSKAFKTVCDQLEYICITAKVKNSQNITHMCNFVYMDGNWYMVDLANAINNSNNADDYFMVPLSNGLVLVNNTVYTLDVSEFAYPPLDSVSYIHLMGDVTLDNELTEDDADLVLAYVLNSAIGFSSRQKLLADLDNDGILTANDAAWIYQLILLQGNNRHYSQRTNGEFGIESDSEMIDSMYEGVNRIFAEMGLPLVSRDTIVSVMGGVDNES